MISEITEKKNTFRYQIKDVAHGHIHIRLFFPVWLVGKSPFLLKCLK